MSVSATTVAVRGPRSSSDSSPKYLPGPELGDLAVVPADAGGALEDEEELVPRAALVDEHAARLDLDLVGRPGDLLQVLARGRREQRDLSEVVEIRVLGGHGAHANPATFGVAPGRFMPAKQTGNTRFVRSLPMEVVIVRWPAERERREQLRRGGRPACSSSRTAPRRPIRTTAWRTGPGRPIDEADLRARVAALEVRSSHHDQSAPSLDADGVLHHHESWVALPPVEARLMAALLDRSGAVVSREALARAGWPDGAPGRNALDVHVLRLRRRVDPLGLVIRTVRSRGYLLESGTRHMATMA